MQLGMFLMPLHDPEGDLHALLVEDRQAIIHADKVGFDEVWVGEHFTSLTEPIPDPLQFLATLIPVTDRIKFGTGVLCLPQHHPLQVATSLAQFDHLSEGRLLVGVGAGSLPTDLEAFGTRQANRTAMMVEAAAMVKQLWEGEPPYTLSGEYWNISISEAANAERGVGRLIKPYQKPFPEFVTTAMQAQSGTAKMAGSLGWGLISANFMPYETARGHWTAYREGALAAGLRPDRKNWRLARSMFVADTDEQARDYLAGPNSVSWYFAYMRETLAKRNMLSLFKKTPDLTDDQMTVERCVADIVISGSARTVIDKIVHMIDEIGVLGGLVVAKADWDNPDMHRRSLSLIGESVMPKVRDYCKSKSTTE